MLQWCQALVRQLGGTPPWATNGRKRRTIDSRAFERALALRNGERTGSIPSVPLAPQPLSALTRSVVVVDLATLSVGILDHEELASAANPRQVLTDLRLDIGRFFLAAARGEVATSKRSIVKAGVLLLVLVAIALVVGGIFRACGGPGG